MDVLVFAAVPPVADAPPLDPVLPVVFDEAPPFAPAAGSVVAIADEEPADKPPVELEPPTSEPATLEPVDDVPAVGPLAAPVPSDEHAETRSKSAVVK